MYGVHTIQYTQRKEEFSFRNGREGRGVRDLIGNTLNLQYESSSTTEYYSAQTTEYGVPVLGTQVGPTKKPLATDGLILSRRPSAKERQLHAYPGREIRRTLDGPHPFSPPWLVARLCCCTIRSMIMHILQHAGPGPPLTPVHRFPMFSRSTPLAILLPAMCYIRSMLLILCMYMHTAHRLWGLRNSMG